MAKVAVTRASLEEIGNAIREKLGTSNSYAPSEMAAAIRSITGGDIVVDPTLTISGAAADARVVGQRFESDATDLSRLQAFDEQLMDTTIPAVADLGAATGIVPIVDFVGAAYIQTNVAAGAVVDLSNPGSSSNFSYKIIDCVPGDMITLNGKGGDAGRLWAFIDADNLLISKAEVNVQATGLVLTAPAGAAKCVINMRTSSIAVCYKGRNLADAIAELAAAVRSLYPAIKIVETSIYPNVLTIGKTYDSIRLDYTCNVIPSAVTVNGNSVGVPVKTFSGSASLANFAAVPTTPCLLSVTDSRGDTDSENVELPLGNYFYFDSAAIPSVIDSAFIASLWNKQVTLTRQHEVSVDVGANEYAWFAFPSRLGTCHFNGLLVHKEITVSHTNDYGYTEDYDVYRSTDSAVGYRDVTIC